ncbi:MAG: hypothetical protein KKE12_20790 [Proteobacteria bacterium]|nr:hypothetical protein [Pseudomonadota bacterium]
MPEKQFSASRVHDLLGSVLGLFALVMLSPLLGRWTPQALIHSIRDL